MVERFSPPAPTSTSVSDEGKKIIQEAYQEMVSWIDSSVDNLVQKTQAGIQAAVTSLEEEFRRAKTDQEESRAELVAELAGFKSDLKDLLGANSNTAISKRIDQLARTVEKELADREKRWRKIGASLGSLAQKALPL